MCGTTVFRKGSRSTHRETVEQRRGKLLRNYELPTWNLQVQSFLWRPYKTYRKTPEMQLRRYNVVAIMHVCCYSLIICACVCVLFEGKTIFSWSGEAGQGKSWHCEGLPYSMFDVWTSHTYMHHAQCLYRNSSKSTGYDLRRGECILHNLIKGFTAGLDLPKKTTARYV